MNRQRHEEELLGPYVLGVLDAEELRRVEEHMSGCVQCREEVAALREMEAALGEVPDEAFFDGPPQGGDLLLQRTLREMRGERDRAAGAAWESPGWPRRPHWPPCSGPVRRWGREIRMWWPCLRSLP